MAAKKALKSEQGQDRLQEVAKDRTARTEEAGQWEAHVVERKARAIEALRNYLDVAELDSKRQRERFAKACGTTWGNLQQILQGQRSIGLWLAINLDRESGGALDMVELFTEADPRHRIDWEYVRKTLRRKPSKV